MSDKKFGLVCCSCVKFKIPDSEFTHYVLTDVLTKKQIGFISDEYEDYDPSDITDAVLNTMIKDNSKTDAFVFIGHYHDSDDKYINFELMPMPPAMKAVSGVVLSCYIAEEQSKRVYKDFNTDKRVEFVNLESFPDLKANADVFLSDDNYKEYSKSSSDRIVLMSNYVDYKHDKILIDGSAIFCFGDCKDAYSNIVNEFKKSFESSVWMPDGDA